MITARHRNIALLVAGCYFMEMLDGTIVTTAAPQIGAVAAARPPTEIGLVVTAYLLTLAVLIPLSGWLTRRLGNRVIFLTAIALFTLASIGCAASVNLGMLVAMRVLQGAGGAMMVPVGRTMVLSPAAKEDILRLTSYVVWPGLLAPVIAPLAGGLITTYASLALDVPDQRAARRGRVRRGVAAGDGRPARRRQRAAAAGLGRAWC